MCTTLYRNPEEREENSDVEEREKERERGSNLRRQRLASPTAQVLVAQTTLLLVSFPSFSLLPTPNRPCQSERSSKARHEADSFEPAEWSERLTPTWAVGLARRCRRRFDPRSRSFSLSSTSEFSSLSSTSVFISSRCSSSCHSPLCPAPVRPGCLFCLFLSLLSPSFQPPIDRVSPNVALKLVTKPILLNRLSGLSD